MTEILAPTAIPARTDAAHRRFIVADEPHALVPSAYTIGLQRLATDATFFGAMPFLVDSASAVAHHQLSTLFASQPTACRETRAQLCSAVYRWAGLGRIDLSALAGDELPVEVSARCSHYSAGMVQSSCATVGPVDHFTAGWLAGAAAAIRDEPLGAFTTRQLTDRASGDSANRFRISRSTSTRQLDASCGIGPLTVHEPWRDERETTPEEAVEIPASGEDGLIHVHGQMMAAQYVNYLTSVCGGLEAVLAERLGGVGVTLAGDLLREQARRSSVAFLDTAMTSGVWTEHVRPDLGERADWIRAAVDMVDSLGWGRWEAIEVAEHEGLFVVHDDIESVASLARRGVVDHDVSYLSAGMAAALMDVVYSANRPERPTEEPIDDAPSGGLRYRLETLASRAMGDELTAYRVFLIA